MNKINEVLNQFVGEICNEYFILEGGVLKIYIGSVTSVEPYLTWLRLSINCAWRIECGNKILIGSLNETELLCEELEKLKGRKVVSIKCDNYSYDLCIELDSGVLIKTFTYSTQDEIWKIYRADGYRFGIDEELQIFESMEVHDDGYEEWKKQLPKS